MSMAAFLRPVRRWSGSTPRRRSRFTISGACRFRGRVDGIDVVGIEQTDTGLISTWFAHSTAFSVTRNPSRGFGIGHICQSGV